MTPQQYTSQQSQVRRQYDPQTGQYRYSFIYFCLNVLESIKVLRFLCIIRVHKAVETIAIRALASARGSVATRRVATGPRARRARGQRARPLEGPKGPRLAESGQNMQVRGPEGPEDEQSEVPVSALASAIICFSQLSSKSRNSWAVFKTLMSAKNHENCSGASYLQDEYRVKKLGQFMDHIKSYATSKFGKNEVFVSKMHRYSDPSLSLSRLFLA